MRMGVHAVNPDVWRRKRKLIRDRQPCAIAECCDVAATMRACADVHELVNLIEATFGCAADQNLVFAARSHV
jgi:hypothetical protein